MAEWSEDHMTAIGLVKLKSWNPVLEDWLNWRPSGAHRWKGEAISWGRSGSGIWKDGTFKAVAPACVSQGPMG
jgi:hypothetical protein